VNKVREDMDSSLRTIDFRDIMKQQLDEEMQSKVDDTIKKEFLSHVSDELGDVHEAVSETREHVNKLWIEKLEQEDIESRHCNIILYRVPDSNEVLVEYRKKNDMVIVRDSTVFRSNTFWLLQSIPIHIKGLYD